MKILVCGGRDYSDSDRVFDTLSGIHDQGEGSRVTLLIEGGAQGADDLAKDWAEVRSVPHQAVKADWGQHGRAAGPIRNQAMLALHPDLVVAFPGGRGTADMVRRARAAGVKVIEVS